MNNVVVTVLYLLLALHQRIIAYRNEGIEMENENERRKIRTKLFYNLVDNDDDTSATAHQIGELCVRRGERAYRPNDANNFNEAEIKVLIEYLCTS